MSKLRVLMYHKVHEQDSDFLTITVDALRGQLTYISKHYTCIRLSELLNHLKSGHPLPENALMITFDDGYLNNYKLAYPILKALQLPFAVFIVSGFMGHSKLYDGAEQTFISELQLHEMSDLAEYGYHGLVHEDLMQLSPEQRDSVVTETVEAFKLLPIQTQNAWAYTYGNFPKKDPKAFENLKNCFIKNNIQCAFRIGNRLNSIPLKDPYKIERLDIRGNESFMKFRLKLQFGKIF